MNKEDTGGLTCRICSDKAKGMHYGVVTCEGCKGFFKRITSSSNPPVFRCYFGCKCPLTPETRNNCKACRLRKCIELGMMEHICRKKKEPPSLPPDSPGITQFSNRPPDPPCRDIKAPSKGSSDSVLATLQATPSGLTLLRQVLHSRAKSLPEVVETAKREPSQIVVSMNLSSSSLSSDSRVDSTVGSTAVGIEPHDSDSGSNSTIETSRESSPPNGTTVKPPITNKKAYLLKAVEMIESMSPPVLPVPGNETEYEALPPPPPLIHIPRRTPVNEHVNRSSFSGNCYHDNVGGDNHHRDFYYCRSELAVRDGWETIPGRQLDHSFDGIRLSTNHQTYYSTTGVTDDLQSSPGRHGNHRIAKRKPRTPEKVIADDLERWLDSDPDCYTINVSEGALDMRTRPRSPIVSLHENLWWKHDLRLLYCQIYDVSLRHRLLSERNIDLDGNALALNGGNAIERLWRSVMECTRDHTALTAAFCHHLPGMKTLPASDVAAVSASSVIGLWLLGYASQQYFHEELLLRLDVGSGLPAHRVSANSSILGPKSSGALFDILRRMDRLALSHGELALLMAIYVTSPVHSGVKCPERLHRLHRSYCDLLRLATRQRPLSDRRALVSTLNDLQERVLPFYKKTLMDMGNAADILTRICGVPLSLLTKFCTFTVPLPLSGDEASSREGSD